MFDIFGKIFGSSKIVDAGISAIDAMIYTDEEKTKSKQEFLKLYQPFKLAQRFLAMATCINFFAFLWVCVATYFLGSEAQLEGLLGIAAEFQVGYLMIVVMAWYFTGGVADFKRNK